MSRSERHSISRSTRRRRPTWRRIVKPLTAFTPEGMFAGYRTTEGRDVQSGRSAQVARRGRLSSNAKCGWQFFVVQQFPVDQVEFIYNSQAANKSVAEWMQAQWKQNLGITVGLAKYGVENFSGSQGKARIQRIRTWLVGRGLHGPVHIPEYFLHRRREWHGLAGSEIHRDAG